MSEERLRRYFYSLISDEGRGVVANVIKLFLSLLSLIYYCAIKVILFLYKVSILKSYRPQCKVISVGNITLGGTGKTPLVLSIARRLKDSGKRLAILIRGYKGTKGLMPSDEAELLKRHLPDIPILIGRDRVRTAKEAINSFGADIILLDDGFQHWRLNRDIDILTLDIKKPFGNEALIPRGILREPLSSIKRADVFVLTKVGCDGDSIAKAQGLKNRVNAINKNATIFTTSYIPTYLCNILDGKAISLSEINGKDLALICGIADPESFEDTIKSLGAKVILRFYFLDHHRYDEAEIDAIIKECKDKGIDTIITTEKDVPRLVNIVSATKTSAPEAHPPRAEADRHSQRLTVNDSEVKFLSLGVELKIDNEEKFFGRLYSIFNR